MITRQSLKAYVERLIAMRKWMIENETDFDLQEELLVEIRQWYKRMKAWR